MSQNRHMSSLRRIGKPNKQRRQKSRQTGVEYEALEDRKLLAADVIFDIPTGEFGRGGPATANQHGAVGPAHIVEVTNGQFRVFDKTTGDELINKSMTAFWTDPGNNTGAGAATEVVGNNIANSKVLYDADTRRWFLVSEGTADVITGAPGTQDVLLLAVSRTSNPTLDWTSVNDVYDVDNNPDTALVTYRGGIGVFGLTNAGVNLGIDGENVYVGGNGGTYLTFNKFSDLVIPNPTAGIPFFGVVRVPVHGQLDLPATTTQVSVDIFGDTNRGSVALTAEAGGGTELTMQVIDPLVPEASEDITIEVDRYLPPPPRVRQLFDPDIENSAGTRVTANSQRVGNSLWAVHNIESSFGGTAAIRWYEIDLTTNSVKQSGTIESPDYSYIYPSISVNEDRNFVIGYTSTGIDKFPSMTVSVGYLNNGLVTVEDPMDVHTGESGYFDGAGNLWGTYTGTALDPDDPTKIYVFGQWSDVSDRGITSIVGLDLIGLSAEISGDSNDNEIIVRRNAIDNQEIEVVIDGAVTHVYEEDVLYEITIDGAGGDDTFIIDYVNGAMDFPGGINFIGDSDDQVEMRTMEHTTYDIGINGGGVAQIGNDFAPTCEPVEEDVRTFNLNFEAGSSWFDATPFDLTGYEQYGYATYGDAFRGELQRYFDETIAPLFTGSFTVTLDINDDEVDTLASATALGIGFDEVDGQMLRVGSPWSIIMGRGDRNGVDVADGVIDYNLDVDGVYGGDARTLLENIAGGLTRNQFFRVLGMQSDTPNQTQDFDPRGDRNTAQVMDTRLIDLNGNPILTDYSVVDNSFLVDNYAINGSWAGDNSGIMFRGIDDSGNELLLPINSNSELIDFDTVASALAGSSRDGDFDDITYQDRAFLRGLGFELNPVVPPVLTEGLRVAFEGVDFIQSGDGADHFCIRSSNVDLQINGGIGNDDFVVTGLGVGAIDLFGQQGDDTYSVIFSPAGVITISDSIGSENDTLIGLGTSAPDTFVFKENGIEVNAGLMVYSGIENITFDGQDSDDVFDVRGTTQGVTGLSGGAGNDTFIVNDQGAGNNGNVLTISVNDPLEDPVDQLRLDLESIITDTYLADQIENFQVDGTFVIDGVNGTPTVAGGLNLLGDGDDRLILDSSVAATWLVDGDGSGTMTADVEPLTFVGLVEIWAGLGTDDFSIVNTNTDLIVHGRDGNDIFSVNNGGSGALTIHGNLGDDETSITNSGGGVTATGDEGLDTFTINDLGLGVIDISGGLDADTINVLNAGSTGVMIRGDEGDDTVEIDNAAGTAAVTVETGADNDHVNVVNSGQGDLLLRGGAGDDLYTVHFVDPVANFTIEDSVNAESDRLEVFASDMDDDIAVDASGLTMNTNPKWQISGIEDYTIDGLLGDDLIAVNMGAAFSGNITLRGNDGDDELVVENGGSGSVLLEGQQGNDHYIVTFQSFTDVNIVDSVGSENDVFTGFGTGLADTIGIGAGQADVNGGTVMMVGVETVIVDGLGGDDTFNINTDVSNTTVRGGFGNDTFNITGVANGNVYQGGFGDDVFNVSATGNASYIGDSGADTFNVDGSDGGGQYHGGDGNDQFHIMEVTGQNNFFGEAGVDHFEVTNHLALGTVSGLINIDAGTDLNTLTVNGYQTRGNFVTVTNKRIAGMSGIPIQYGGVGTFSLGQPVGGITLIGSDNHNDGFDINGVRMNDSVLVLGGGGNDRATVREATLGRVSVDLQEGTDLYQFAVGSQNNRNLSALDSGVVGADRIVITLSEGDDNVRLGGQAFSVQTDNFKFNDNFESMVVNARGGNDFIDINQVEVGFMRIIAGAGNDQLVVNNLSGLESLLLQGGDGDDTVTVNSGTVNPYLMTQGGNGNDTFTISQNVYTNASFDGQEGSDTYNVFVADRGARYVVARDSGTTGTDTLNLVGTVLNDRIDMRTGVMTIQRQTVYYNQNTETANIRTGASPDVISVYGFSSQTANVMSESDTDIVFVNSTFGPGANRALNVDLGVGDDVAVVRYTTAETTTSIFGRAGTDLINIGSTLAENNGNLDSIRGPVFVDGGDAQDRLNLNDAGRAAAFNYNIGPGFVSTGANSPSNNFGGVTFANTEKVRLDGTIYRNHVDITPSVDTEFSLFGHGGANTISLNGNQNDGQLSISDDGKTGFWTFDNDLMDIYFEDFVVV